MLTSTPDVRYLDAFVSDPADLFQRSRATLSWDQRMRARETASCGIAYNYSGIDYPDCPMPDFIELWALRVSEIVGHPINNCLANYYPDGESRMGFHSDSSDGIVAETSTSIISLGDVRTLTFRPKRDRSRHVHRPLAAGSLLVMAPSVQIEWQHGLLPANEAGPRLSLTFRQLQQIDPSK